MNAWEIWSYQPPGWPEPHPAVIVSSNSRAGRKPEVNVLMCATKRATRTPELNEVVLDQADGLDWPTICKCDLLHLVNKAKLNNRRGQVTEGRRRAIIETMLRSNEWAL